MSGGFLAEDEVNSWKKEWQGMPEFTQNKEEPYNAIIVRFASKEDQDEFAKLIGQNLTPKTDSIWFPKLVKGKHSHKRYVDSED